MHYVYMLMSKKDSWLYTGYSNDLRARFAKHNAGKVRATKARIPFKLVYYEAYLDEWDAREREFYFKSGWGRKYIQTKLARTLQKAKS